jgi:hypothetical protein
MKKILFFCTFLILLFGRLTPAYSEEKCVNTEGEAIIVNKNIVPARLEATARARWSAVGLAAGVETKTKSFEQSFPLLEDIIKTKSGYLIKSFKITDEKITADKIKVRINACVDIGPAKESISRLALNNSIAIFIPAGKPGYGGNRTKGKNVLFETLTAILAEQNYIVLDAVPGKTIEAEEIERAVQSGNNETLRGIMNKFSSHLLLTGKVDYTVSSQKGEKTGRKTSMTLNNVTAHLNYHIIARNNKTGNLEILAAGAEQARGLANSEDDATAEAMKDLAQNIAPSVLDKVGLHIKNNTKKISVKVNGADNDDKVAEVVELLKSIVWVSDVEETQKGNFIVRYPENTLYLVGSIRQKGKFKVVSFSSYSLVLDYLK